MHQDIFNQQATSGIQSFETTKVLRNTYALLAMTLLFSAITAAISMAVGVGHGLSLVFSIAAIVLVWFVLPRTANSATGILVVFAFTGLLGASLGPLLSYYLKMANGGMVVTQALGGTALVFFALSAYVLTTRKDFSFMGGFLFVGLIVALVAMVGMVIASSFFGADVSMFHLGLSMIIVLLMSGFILYDTSRIINGGETNYIMATTSLYLNIYNLFVSLLHILGVMNDD
jgi:modulator of FtsH protease